MTKFIGFLLFIGAIILGFYVGRYLCFFKGIVQVIEEIRAPIMETKELAWGICKVVFAGAIGGFCFFVPGVVGWTMMDL